jgi:galactokinase
VTSLRSALVKKFREVFGRAPTEISRAPGRVEFIGNHTDYNGGTVLGAALDRSIWVAIAPRDDRQWRFCSASQGAVVTLPVGKPRRQTGKASWLNYPLGVISAMPRFGLKTPLGFDLLVMADLPTGAGLSSSAALELSSGLAFLALTRQRLPKEMLVKMGRDAENRFVGVPCGILDQGCSGFGRKDRLVRIDCRGPKFSTVPLPGGAQFWIFNTHAEHALVDGLYSARHKSCMAAAKALKVPLLADATLAQLEAGREKMSDETYRRARHVIEEIGRVNATVSALRVRNLKKVGQLLLASHESSRTLFENSTPELDFLVETLAKTPNVYGARLTGGGFGGAVMALTSKKFGLAQAKRVAAIYARRFGHAPDILNTKTGDGAALES